MEATHNTAALRRDRALGALLGLACGDAVGTTVEVRTRCSFAPLADMVGGGPYELQPGQWTDDTSMALCLAASLAHCNGFDAIDQMNRYVNWWRVGYFSSTGDCFDIGMTTQRALQRYLDTGDPIAGSTEPNTAGNGSLMRLAPVALFFHPDLDATLRHARLSSATTHGAPEALDCCELLAVQLHAALAGADKAAVLRAGERLAFATPRVQRLAAQAHGEQALDALESSGYCVASLEAALWCFAREHDFASTVLAAANPGDDADTVAAIAGQLAGAFYGRSGIPAAWLEKLAMSDEIEELAERCWRA